MDRKLISPKPNILCRMCGNIMFKTFYQQLEIITYTTEIHFNYTSFLYF
jgi:hypothetical protein